MCFSGLYSNFFRKTCRNVVARWSKLLFSCPEQHKSWKKLLFGKCWFFSNSDLEHILFESFAATFRQLRENCNPGFHRNFLNNKCFLFDRNHSFFVQRLRARHFPNFKQNYSISFVKTALNISGGTIGWNFFLNKF